MNFWQFLQTGKQLRPWFKALLVVVFLAGFTVSLYAAMRFGSR